MMFNVGPQIQNAAKIYHPVSESIMVQSISHTYAITSIRNLQHFYVKYVLHLHSSPKGWEGVI